MGKHPDEYFLNKNVHQIDSQLISNAISIYIETNFLLIKSEACSPVHSFSSNEAMIVENKTSYSAKLSEKACNTI